MLANLAKSYKIVRMYKGLLKIGKGKDCIETGTSTIVDFADYLIDNNLVLDILDKVIEFNEEDVTVDPIDDAILELKEDPSKIVSPNDNIKIDIKQIEDGEAEIDPEEDKLAEEVEDEV